MAPKPKFTEGERVLCFHGPLLYEAKCTKHEVKDKMIRYFIHYNGWNKNWDEWVPETRVLKCNEAGVQKQKELQKAHAAEMSKKRKLKASLKKNEKDKKDEKDEKKDKEKDKKEKREDKEDIKKDKKDKKEDKEEKEDKKEKKEERASTPSMERSERKRDRSVLAPSTPQSAVINTSLSDTPNTAEPPRKKRARGENAVESEESFITKMEVKVKIPDELKPWLVDDWDLISRQKRLVSLPTKLSVEKIIEDYVKFKTDKGTAQKDAVTEVMEGIKEYFNVMLGTQLLYKFERPQYGEILSEHKDKPMSQIYGATHLLRLFVKIGSMLAYTRLDEKSVMLLLYHIHDFLKYMQKNMATFFVLSEYIVAPPEYHRKAI